MIRKPAHKDASSGQYIPPDAQEAVVKAAQDVSLERSVRGYRYRGVDAYDDPRVAEFDRGFDEGVKAVLEGRVFHTK